MAGNRGANLARGGKPHVLQCLHHADHQLFGVVWGLERKGCRSADIALMDVQDQDIGIELPGELGGDGIV